MLAARVADWAAGCRQLRFPDPRSVAEQVESERAVLAAVESVVTAALQEIIRQEQAREARLTATRPSATSWRAGGELAAERDLPPPTPPTPPPNAT